ncbi:MAG: CHAD domain-containing protein [Verrucomicrobia bacterium]|nr:CHAD domain-containing protein [Verrucomicrobiota bacterium]
MSRPRVQTRPEARLHRHLIGSLRRQWKRYRKRLKKCQEKFTEEAVHDFRVEARRLLSVLGLIAVFDKAGRVRRASRAVKAHLDTFDTLRDTQVHLLRVAPLCQRFAEARRFQDYLRKREKKCAAAAAREVQRIKTKRLERWLNELEDDLRRRRKQGEARHDFAAVIAAVDRAFAAVSRYRQEISASRPQTIHRTRIAFKRFRYMVEALATLLPGEHEEWLRAMQAYQTMMGDVQDVEVARERLERFAEKRQDPVAAVNSLKQEFERESKAAVRACLVNADRLYDFWRRLPPTGKDPT